MDAAAPAVPPSRTWHAIEPTRSILQWMLVSAVGLVALYLWSSALGLVLTRADPFYTGYWIRFSFLFGAPLILLYGAPGYLILERKGRARAKHVLILGLAPTALFLRFGPTLFAVAAISAAFVALATHHGYRLARRLRLEPAA